MANRYANLVGSNKIKDEYQKINIGFDKVEQEMDEKPDNSFAKINDVKAEGEDEVTIEAGTGITITTTPEEKKIRITATGEAAPGPHGPEHNHDGADPIPDLVQLRELGLGIDVDPRLSSDLNNEINTGWVTTNSETLNTPPGLTHGVVRIERRLSNRVIQTYHHLTGGTSPQIHIYTRVLGDDWSDWVALLHTGNTTDIVNQDYETGEWTPVLAGLDVPGNHTYSVRRGNYHIIGDRIFVSGELRIASSGFDSNMSGGIVISGIPFAQRDSTNDSTAFTIGVRAGIDSAKPVYGYIGRGENVLSLISGWTSDRVRITHEDLSTPIHISFSGHYRI